MDIKYTSKDLSVVAKQNRRLFDGFTEVKILVSQDHRVMLKQN